MKVFISWSGDLSKGVAELLKRWVRCVLQVTEPFVSTEDIAKGSMWFSGISDQLKDTSVGIICLTRENMNEPWILFEAGALAKGLTTSRVCTLLINLKPADLKPPLASFNATMPTKDDLFRMMGSINQRLDDKVLPDDILKMTFEQFWPVFQTTFEKVMGDYKPAKEYHRRPPEEIIEEVLEVSRQNQRVLEESRQRLEEEKLHLHKEAFELRGSLGIFEENLSRQKEENANLRRRIDDLQRAANRRDV